MYKRCPLWQDALVYLVFIVGIYYFDSQTTNNSIRNYTTLWSLCKYCPLRQDALVVYCFFCWYIFIYISTSHFLCYFYLHLLCHMGLFRSWVRYWKIVTNTSNIICLAVFILASQLIWCNLWAQRVGYINNMYTFSSQIRCCCI